MVQTYNSTNVVNLCLCLGFILSHSFSGQFSRRFQGPHSPWDGHEGDAHFCLVCRYGPYSVPSWLLMWELCHKVAMNVYELSSAAGLPCEIDPALVVALSSQKSGETPRITENWSHPIPCAIDVWHLWCSFRREHQSGGGVQDRLPSDGVRSCFTANTGQQRHVPVQPRHRR